MHCTDWLGIPLLAFFMMRKSQSISKISTTTIVWKVWNMSCCLVKLLFSALGETDDEFACLTVTYVEMPTSQLFLRKAICWKYLISALLLNLLKQWLYCVPTVSLSNRQSIKWKFLKLFINESKMNLEMCDAFCMFSDHFDFDPRPVVNFAINDWWTELICHGWQN